MNKNKAAIKPLKRSRTEVDMKGSFDALYKNWMDAIMYDDDVTVNGIILSSTEEEKQVLLDPLVGPLSFRPQGEINICNGSIGEEQANEFEVDCPWILACCYGSTKVLRVLYKEGVDIYYADDQGDNCLHSMAKLCALHLDLQPTMIFTYNFLVELLTLTEMQKLLMHENMRELRPLEEAMYQETFSLFTAIFNTKDVYLVNEVRCGIQTVQYFDVSDYEDMTPNNRANTSPLLLMEMMSGKDECSSEARNVALAEPMKTWYIAKKKTCTPFIYLWALFRIGYITLYFYSENLLFSNTVSTMWNMLYNQSNTVQAQNNMSSTSDQATQTFSLPSGQLLTLTAVERNIMTVTIFLSAWIVVVDVVEVIRKLIKKPAWFKWRLKPKSRTMAQYHFYRGVQFAVASLTLYLCVLVILLATPNIKLNIDLEAVQIGYSFVVAFCAWSIMFFLQLIPWLGHFVVAVQRMLGDLVKFFIIYCLFMIPYVMALYLALSESQETKQFSTVGKAIYSTFLTMLNMVSYIEYTKTPVYVTLFTIHILYVFMISILLINFLIAMFSSSYNDVTQNRDVIFIVQSLSVCFSLEGRLLGPLKYLRKWLQRRYFVENNGRYYITKMFIAKSQSLEEHTRKKYIK